MQEERAATAQSADVIRRLAKATKAEIAVGIVDEVERLLEERRGGQ